MNADLLLRNAAVYSLQITIIIAAAGALAAVLGVRSPGARLRIWHAVLAGCLLMPALAPWQTLPPSVQGDVTATSIALGTVRDATGAGFALRWPFTAAETVLLLFALGSAVRLTMLGIGMLRLKRMARRAQLIWPEPASVEQAKRIAGASPQFCWSEEIAGPVTFGFFIPVVLLPVSFAELSEKEAAAVALHEALHVRRRDWLFTMAEELVRAMLWFHPAVWFVLNRVQLAREQTVDQFVVKGMRGSENYLDALLKIAASQVEPDLAPAPLFLKKRHLRERVDAIMKGTHMSAKRLAVSILTLLVALPTTAFLVATYLPLLASAQSIPDSAGVEVKTGPFKVLHRAPVQYPLEARDTGQEGTVILSVTVDPSGEVTDARVVNASGPESLRRAALSSILQWHFSTDPVEVAPGDRRPLPSTFEVAIGFHPGQTAKMSASQAVARPPDTLMTIEKVDLTLLPPDLRPKVEQALTLREGQAVREEDLEQQRAALRKIDSHLVLAKGRISSTDPRNLRLAVMLRIPPVSMEGAVPPARTATEASSSQRIRVGGNVQEVNLINKVTPLYPPLAKQARVQGTVRFQVVIDKEGRVQNIELQSGHPLLVPAAIEAVKQWVYRPTLLNGNPVEVMTQIDINFTLSDDSPPANQ